MEFKCAAKRSEKLSPRKETVLLLGVACLGALVLTIIPRAAAAQVTTGTILGTVSDPSGAAIPRARGIITKSPTKILTTFETEAAGDYVLPYLIPVVYE